MLRRYFGQDQVHFLRELPRERVDHLDYVLKFTDSQTCLIAKPYGEFLDTLFHRFLSRETKEALQYNETYLRQTFPHLKLIQVPLIPPARDSEDMFLESMRRRFIRNLAWQRKLITEEHYRGPSDEPIPSEAIRSVYRILEQETGLRSLATAADMDRALRFFFDQKLDDMRFVYTDQTFHYRSHLNSLFLINAEGRERFVIPRFRPIDGSEERWMPEIEDEVEAAYREARPNADIVWIDADAMAQYGGVLHCTTFTFPSLPQPE